MKRVTAAQTRQGKARATSAPYRSIDCTAYSEWTTKWQQIKG